MRPTCDTDDTPFEYASLLAPDKRDAWQKKLASLSYTPPKYEKGQEVISGISAVKMISEWLSHGTKIDSDGRGFWLMYELMTGSLNLKVLHEDNTHTLGALLLRLSARGYGDELLPLLRLLENERQLASELPKFKDGERAHLRTERVHASGMGPCHPIHCVPSDLRKRAIASGTLAYWCARVPRSTHVPHPIRIRSSSHPFNAPRRSQRDDEDVQGQGGQGHGG